MALSQPISWPGVLAVESFVYTVSHGVSPGIAILTTLPQVGDKPAEFGNLIFGDGERVVVLKDCKADAITPRVGPDGTTWILQILDRRWKWATGRISGRYNQRDPRGKLVPWTIRSLPELAKLCLDAIGEKNYLIDLPVGLTRADGANIDTYLAAGENLPQTLANPPVVWDNTPPMAALARLVEEFGRRVVYQPINNRVVVAQQGLGASLPNGPYEAITATIDAPETPARVCVAGAPIRYQMRLLLTPVGEEWDGSYRPIKELSYAPTGSDTGSPQTSVSTYVGDAPTTDSVRVDISFRLKNDEPFTELTFSNSDPIVTVADKLTAIAAQINASPAKEVCIASAAGTVLTVTGKIIGKNFRVEIFNGLDGAENFSTVVTLSREPDETGVWDNCGPPTYSSVRATDRLTKLQAQELARRSVWLCYRIRNVDVSTKKYPIKVPGYGNIERRQQLILTGSKVEQVVPEPRAAGARTKGERGFGVVPEFYNGYSRDQGADVFGSIARSIGRVIWDNAGDNTDATKKVYVSFSVDPEEQLVRFSEAVFENLPAGSWGRFGIPNLVLETAVIVQATDTGALARHERTLFLGGAGPDEWQIREDVQASYQGTYTNKHVLTAVLPVDHNEADQRAAYYLQGMAKRYQVTGGETRNYIGIYGIDPDGFIQQISWSLGSAGPSTTASTNTEHDEAIPPYPARRRAENLPPNFSAALANFAGSGGKDRTAVDPISIAGGIVRRL